MRLSSLPRFALLATVTAAVFGVTASPAHAEVTKVDKTVAWGAATAELATVGFVALRFGAEVIPDGAPAYVGNFAPVVLGAGAALAAHRWDLDGRPAYAVHGAIWGGTGMFLLGAAIEGRKERSGLDAGGLTYALAAGGVLAGGALGMVGGQADVKTSLLAPTVGLGVGALGGIGAVLVSGDVGGDRTARRIIIGLGTGVTAGVVGGALVARWRGGERRERSALVPVIEPAPDRVLVALGGQF
jgi:hypothetical protein